MIQTNVKKNHRRKKKTKRKKIHHDWKILKKMKILKAIAIVKMIHDTLVHSKPKIVTMKEVEMEINPMVVVGMIDGEMIGIEETRETEET